MTGRASIRNSQLQPPHKPAADPFREAAVITAASGSPPAPHEQLTVRMLRPCLLGFCADRLARYKESRQAGTHGLCVGPHAERDARRWHAEGTGVSYSVTECTRHAADAIGSTLSISTCVPCCVPTAR